MTLTKKKFLSPIAICIAATVACLLIYAFTKHSGIGISPDSVAYLSTATHIQEQFSFTDFSGAPFVNFPLGYPVFLSVASALFSFPFINALLFVVTIMLTNRLMPQKLPPAARLFILILIALCAPMLEVYIMLWSETVFIPLCLYFLLTLKKYFQVQNIRQLLLAGILCSLAFVVRYAGVTCLITGILLLSIQQRNTIIEKVKNVLMFGSIGIALPALNILRNSLISGTYTGVRQIAERTIAENYADLATVFAYWFPLNNSVIVAQIVVTIAIITTLFFLLKLLNTKSDRNANWLVPATFFIVYICFMLLISSISRFESLSNRLLIPAFIPLLLLVADAVLSIGSIQKKILKYTAISVALCFYIATIYQQFTHQLNSWEGVSYAGIPGYTEDQWTNSATLHYLKKHKPSDTQKLYSNANDAVYFGTKHNALALPHKDIDAEINAFKQNNAILIVWLFNGLNDDLINLQDATANRKIIRSLQLKDGLLIYCE